MWEKLNNEENLKKLEESFKSDIASYNTESAKILFYTLKDILPGEKIEEYLSYIAESYYKMMYQAGFFAISLLKKEDAEIIFSKGLRHLFEISDEFVFLDEFRKFFIYNFSNLADRIIEKENFQKILEESKEPFVGSPAEGKDTKPIGSWVRNYLGSSGDEEPSTIKLGQYVNNSESTKSMEEQNRKKVSLLLRTYDYCRLAQFKPFLIDEEIAAFDENGNYIYTGERKEKFDPAVEKNMKEVREALGLPPAVEEKKPEPPKETAPPPVPQVDWEKMAGEVLGGVKLNLPPGDLERFKKTLITYLREVRTKMQFLEVLKRNKERGGFELDPKTADFIINKADDKKKEKGIESSSPNREIKKSEKPVLKKKEEIKLLPKKQEQPKSAPALISKPEPRKEPVEKKILLAPPPPAIRPVVAPKPELKKEVPKKDFGFPQRTPREEFKKELPKIESKPERKESKTPIFTPRPAPKPAFPKTEDARPLRETGRPKMEDVKYVPKLVGPVEELRRLSLDDFHKLSSDTDTAAQKIKDKMNLLAEESFGKKVEGIKAWKESPLYKKYLNVGQQSLVTGKNVGAIIVEMKNKGEEGLTEEEFNAIMELNKEMRF